MMDCKIVKWDIGVVEPALYHGDAHDCVTDLIGLNKDACGQAPSGVRSAARSAWLEP